MRKLTQEEFVEKANVKHKFRYTYPRFIYVDGKIKGLVTCNEHGDFLQRAESHLRGQGCAKCADELNGNKIKITYEEFVERANVKHNFYYTYPKFVYVDSGTKGIITCPVHGDFQQKANDHLCGRGCDDCGGTKTLTTEIFIKKSNIKHNHKYTYLRTIVINNKKKVIITCSNTEHGDFLQSPKCHMIRGQGCPKCGRESAYLKIYGITYEEYQKQLSKYKKYQKEVKVFTNKQPIQTLLNYGKRGVAGKEEAYHLDHKYSTWAGYRDKIAPEIIGNIANLEFITWEDNLVKHEKCSISLEVLVALIEVQKSLKTTS